MVEIKNNGVQDLSDLPAARIEEATKYQEYLKEFKKHPCLTGRFRPMTQEEFENYQTNVIEPLNRLAELANKDIK